MRIVHINTADIDGGAARAAYRLHRGLLDHSVNSHMVVQNQGKDDFTVHGLSLKWQKAVAKFRVYMDTVPRYFYIDRQNTPWSSAWTPTDTISRIKKIHPDIVHLHWIGNGFFSIKNIGQIDVPVVWTLHDSWAFTGGCHIPFDCSNYRDNCGQCPQLGSQFHSDLSKMIWKWKQQVFDNKKMIVVAPSNWMKKCAKDSSLLANKQVEVIPNGINTNLYKPIDKYFARQVLGISPEEKVILFGAMSSTSDPNKGFQYLQPALTRLATIYENTNVKILIFGASTPRESINFPYPVEYIGRLYDDISLVLLYSAADVMLVPSQQESFGQTASEAMSCGTPVVAFATSGLIDIIDHKKNGYLAASFEPVDFAQGLAWILEDDERWNILSYNARKKVVDTFDINIVANKYINLYEEILE